MSDDKYTVEEGGLLHPEAFLPLPPEPVWQPAQFGLLGTVHDLEFQLGTVGAYNALAEAARKLHEKIKHGDAEDQSPQTRLWGKTPPKFLSDRIA